MYKRQVQLHPIEQGAVVGDVPIQQGLDVLGQGLAQGLLSGGHRVLPLGEMCIRDSTKPLA